MSKIKIGTFYPRPADSIGHSVRPSSLPPSLRLKCRKKSNSNFLALELDGDLGFSHGHQGSQGHRPHDDDDDEEDDNEVEDNDKDNNNNKDDKGISALRLDRDLGFREDIKDVKGIGLMMMTTMRRRIMRWRTRTTTTSRISQLWD